MQYPSAPKAPDFTLKSKQASGLVDVKLSDNFGKRTLCCSSSPRRSPAFAPASCATSLRASTNYTGLNANIIAVSVDTPFAQEAWAQKEKIGITLASDLNKEVIKKYDVVFRCLPVSAILRRAPRSSLIRTALCNTVNKRLLQKTCRISGR